MLIGRTLRPLSTLTRTARALSESSLDQRIRLTGPRDEVADLADTFDDMLGRLQAAFDAERRFVANASHELRTPLAVIRTEVEVTMADPAADEAELRRMGEIVLEATDRANRLLTSLLLLARTQARGVSVQQHGRPGRPDRTGVARGRRRTARSGSCRSPSTPSPAPVYGDPALLERLVGNLVENAVRHNVPGGWIEIRTETVGAQRGSRGGLGRTGDRRGRRWPNCSNPSGRASGPAPGTAEPVSGCRSSGRWWPPTAGPWTRRPIPGGGLRVTVRLGGD